MTETVFEIRISREGRRYRIRASAPTRKSPPREKEEVVAPIKNIREDILQLQEALLRSSESRRGPTAIQIGNGVDNRIIQELGNKLFDFLFPKGIAEFYRQNRTENLDGLRLRLIVDEDVSELSTIPWEAVYDKERRSFLATEQIPLFTRAVENVNTQMQSRERLNILGMIANPTEFRGQPLDAINSAIEKRNLEEALRPLAGKAKLTWTTSGTYRELRRHLLKANETEGGWSVFHYIGHGDFDESEHKGFLILEEDGGSRGEAHYSDELRPLLTAPRAPQLVVLNACNSARSASGDLFSSTAGDLVLGGVPAVVAMQFPVSDDMAVDFAKEFYNVLADGVAIHVAMAESRNRLRARRFAEWITPVLYLQSDDGTFYRSSAH